MANISISEIQKDADTLENEDLILVSQNNGNGSFTSAKMKGSVLKSQMSGGDVKGPSSSVNSRVATFSGTTGKVIQDSGFTIAKSVPADAKFTDTTYSVATTSSAGLMSASDKTRLDSLLNLIYPVGSIYTTINASFDPATSFGGTWEQIASGKCLWGSNSSHAAGTSINAGLPKPALSVSNGTLGVSSSFSRPTASSSLTNPTASTSVSLSGLSTSTDGAHTHTVSSGNESGADSSSGSGRSYFTASTKTTSSSGSHSHTISGTATATTTLSGGSVSTTLSGGSVSTSLSGSVTGSISTDTIYGTSTTVQPAAVAVIFWKRTA